MPKGTRKLLFPDLNDDDNIHKGNKLEMKIAKYRLLFGNSKWDSNTAGKYIGGGVSR